MRAARPRTRARTILDVIMSRNSLKSMVPEPSLSTSAIIFLISSFLGSKPRARIATLSSLASIVPERRSAVDVSTLWRWEVPPRTRAVCVEEVECLADLLLLLLRELHPLAGFGSTCASLSRSKGKGTRGEAVRPRSAAQGNWNVAHPTHPPSTAPQGKDVVGGDARSS